MTLTDECSSVTNSLYQIRTDLNIHLWHDFSVNWLQSSACKSLTKKKMFKLVLSFLKLHTEFDSAHWNINNYAYQELKKCKCSKIMSIR